MSKFIDFIRYFFKNFINFHKLFLKLLFFKKIFKFNLINIESNRDFYKNFMISYYKNGYYNDNFKKNLYKNLDKNSINILNRCLNLNNYLAFNENLNYNILFNKDDIKIITETHSFRYRKIKKVKQNFILYYKKKIKVLSNDLEIGTLISDDGLKFLNNSNIKKYLKNKIAITAGAFTGDSVFCLLDYNFKKILAFEPNINLFKFLKKNIILNKLEYLIEPLNFGLSIKNDNLYFKSAGMCSHISNFNDYDYKIKVVNLDEFIFKSYNSEKIGFIHLDVEGFEFEVIKGASKIIKKYKPILAISIYHNPKDFFEIKPYLEKLVPDYSFRVIKTRGSPPSVDILLMAYLKD